MYIIIYIYIIEIEIISAASRLTLSTLSFRSPAAVLLNSMRTSHCMRNESNMFSCRRHRDTTKDHRYL